jgi:hypothetical protein
MWQINFVSYQDNSEVLKIVKDASNQLHACSDYHSVIKDGSHYQSEQDMKDFYCIEGSSVTHRRDTSIYKIKIEVIKWSFHIEHITNLVTSMKRDVDQEDETTILLKKWSWLAWSEQRRLIGDCQFVGSPIRTKVHQVWWRVQGLVTTPQILPISGAHWRSKTK